jgi:hypothetical protein
MRNITEQIILYFILVKYKLHKNLKLNTIDFLRNELLCETFLYDVNTELIVIYIFYLKYLFNETHKENFGSVNRLTRHANLQFNGSD